MIYSVGKQKGGGERTERRLHVGTPVTVFPFTLRKILLLFFFSFLKPSECWESVHKRGVRASHRWESFRAGSPACVACYRSPAERKCNPCNDLLCLACFNERCVQEGIRTEDDPAHCFRITAASVGSQCRWTGAQICVWTFETGTSFCVWVRTSVTPNQNRV